MRSSKLTLLFALALLILLPGCALIDLVSPSPTPTATVERVLRPTFTPTPFSESVAPPVEQPVAQANQAEAPILAQPVEPQPEQSVVPTVVEPPATEPLPTDTPAPTATPTSPPTATPIPIAIIANNAVRARSGPDQVYPKLGEFNAGVELTFIARNEDATWWQLCCLDGQQVWVFGELLDIQGNVGDVPIANDIPPTPTPTPIPSPTPTPTPSAYIVVANPRVNVRSGPGSNFKVLGVVERGDRLTILGRNYLSDWWQVCCIDGETGWIIDRLVKTEGPISRVKVPPGLPAPKTTPRPTFTFSLTPTATPNPALLPMKLTGRELFPFGDNDYFRAGVKVRDPSDSPLGGYYLRVRNETSGQQWLSNESSSSDWAYTAPNADFADFREINIEFDTDGQSPQAGNTYAVWLVDAGGKRMSPIVRFEPDDDELLWLHVVFTRK